MKEAPQMTAEEALPPLPEPAFFVSEDSARRGLYQCFRKRQTLLQHGGQAVYENGYTAEQMHAYVLADRASRAAPQPTELLRIARLIEDLKRPCGMDPESPTAIRNGRYMSIAAMLRALAASQPLLAPQGGRE